MPPAARIGDFTGHGSTPLTPASPPPHLPDVIIENKPAWIAVDYVHVCPLVNGTVPHVGGNVLIGSTSVFINDRPAVRMGDKVMEPGAGPNPITSGATSVVIGG
jgi:uncharacterized Zn-binding protein involved in type VI secretion